MLILLHFIHMYFAAQRLMVYICGTRYIYAYRVQKKKATLYYKLWACYRRACSIPFQDHILQELSRRFFGGHKALTHSIIS